MIIKSSKEIPSSEITDPAVFGQRRKIIKAFIASIAGSSNLFATMPASGEDWKNLPNPDISNNHLAVTASDLVKKYINYYEFDIDKEKPAEMAQKLQIDPWSVSVFGEVETPLTFAMSDILNRQNLQEFIYRHRCVEGWSMVVPWVGFRLADLLKRVKPLSNAKFVKFTSVYQPQAMPSQRNHSMLQWPYVEALRIDEAYHPLTILAVGMYGNKLPKQNGAPLRLVVPWKYGFKSIKAIVKIELVKRAPLTSWSQFAPAEYGFYANVNPSVPHPRWSQISERPLGSRFFTARRETEIFNGYGEQVASMYRDMDLQHFF